MEFCLSLGRGAELTGLSHVLSAQKTLSMPRGNLMGPVDCPDLAVAGVPG